MKIFSYFIIFGVLGKAIFCQPNFINISANSESVEKYNKLELTVELSASFSNPFDESDINLNATFTSPSGKKKKVSGFFYQDFIRSGPPETLKVNGLPHWKIRFSPDETGVWSYKLTCKNVTGTATSAEKNFTCMPSLNKGFIRVANKNFLKYEDGSNFFPVGVNIPWYESDDKSFDYEKWINALSADKGNFIRVWMASKSFAIEWTGTPLGDYRNRLDRAFQLDRLFDYAKDKNINIQLCLYSHGMFSTQIDSEWSFNPYNLIRGGIIENPYEFFTDTNATNFNKMKMRYIIARWGYASNLAAWELFNEVDNVDSFYTYKTEISEWLLKTASYIKENDINKHLITSSYYNELLDELLWTSPLIDFSQTHHYNTSADVQSSHYSFSQSKVNDFFKPSIIGEFDFKIPGDFGFANDPDGIDFHNTIWANSFSGAFGSPLSWSWDKYVYKKNLNRHFKSLVKFFEKTDLVSDSLIPVIAICTTQSRVPLTITPEFNRFDKAPQNLFDVNPDGFITPSVLDLSRYLFGQNSHQQVRNPPTFQLLFEQNGEFKVTTGSEFSVNPKILIKMDNLIKLEQPAYANSTYSINVPSGYHRINIDNNGSDWVKLEEFTVTNFVKGIRSYALRGDSTIIGWVQNRNYNWKYLKDTGYPDSVTDGRLQIYGIKRNGFYKTEWFDCSEGNLISSGYTEATSNSVTIDVPPLLWDLSYKLTYFGTSNVADNPAGKQFILFNNYPNPFNPETTIKFFIATDSRVKITLYDILGRNLGVLLNDLLKTGEHKIVLNANDYKLSSGVIFYRIETGDINKISKMLLIK